MDHAAHRHSRAADRRRGRDHRRHGLRGGTRRACRRRRRRPVDRSHRAGDLDARQHVPGQRGGHTGRPRHHRGRRFRPAGGVLGLRVRPCHRGRSAESRRLQAGAGDRVGDLLAHPRLEGSHHLRAVRRRRRRRGGGGPAAARHARRSRHPHRAPALRRPIPLASKLYAWTAARPRRAPSDMCAWRAVPSSSMRWP